eukprot:TRINITY_DN6354_c0_g1_i1.p1 TRINITY_DN6354_c0_g1~~TRINITY_DN6354_c0_g1_i1.p1  ORF type:complete len:189 (-),score=22.82 TRINITY_DN6354_c0_g1_i1:74-640(-)
MRVTRLLYRGIYRQMEAIQYTVPYYLQRIQRQTIEKCGLSPPTDPNTYWKTWLRDSFRQTKSNELLRTAFAVYNELNTQLSSIPKNIPPIKYAEGTKFFHKTYGFKAVIKRADRVCMKDESWIKSMNLDSLLSQGRYQPFYECSVLTEQSSHIDVGTSLYVAQENIVPITETDPSDTSEHTESSSQTL